MTEFVALTNTENGQENGLYGEFYESSYQQVRTTSWSCSYQRSLGMVENNIYDEF